MRTYKIKLWKNYGAMRALSIFVFIFGLGLAMYLVGIAFLIAGVASFLGASPKLLTTSSGYMGLFIGLLFSYGGHMCLWGFFSSYKENVSFTEKEIIYRCPRKSLFFLYKEKVVPYSAIKGVFFGSSIMKKTYSDDVSLIPGKYAYKYNNSGLEVYFEKEGKPQIMELPIFQRYPEYYAELRKLIADLGLWQTEAKCLFLKDGALPQSPGSAAAGKKETILQKHSPFYIKEIRDIIKILLVLVIAGALAYLGYYLGMKGIL